MTIRPGKRARNGRGEQVHVPGEHDQVDAVLLEPGRHHEVALLAARVAVERERRRRDPGCARTIESVGVLPVGARPPRSAGRRRSAPADSCRCRRRARRSRDPPDHRLAGAGLGDDGAPADPEVEHAPQLLLRDVAARASSNTGGRGHESQSISARRPLGSTRVRLPRMPPPVTCANAFARPLSARASSR